MTDQLTNIIQNCKLQKKEAQEQLYLLYKDVLFAICVRYVKSTVEAEDVFIEGFYKILTKIDDFKGEGSFEGWIKRIMVNESLMHLRKKNRLTLMAELTQLDIVEETETDQDVLYEELLKALEELPTGYRTVFNLYVIEGYKHREIGEMLGISINTSKSQLILSKKRIQEILKKKELYFNKQRNNLKDEFQ